MTRNSLRERVSNGLARLRTAIRSYGDDLYAYVFGQTYSIISTVSVELVRLYWIIVIQLYTFYVVPYAIIFGLILESRRLGSFIFALSCTIGFVIGALTVAFWIVRDDPPDPLVDKAGDVNAEVQVEEELLPSDFASDIETKSSSSFLSKIGASLHSIISVFLAVFSINAGSDRMIGRAVRVSAVLLFLILVFLNNAKMTKDIRYVEIVSNNPIIAMSTEIFQHLVVNPIVITISFVFGLAQNILK